MGRFYNINYTPFDPGAADESMVSILASANHGFKVHRIILTSADTAGATVVEVRLYQTTDQGTGTANTPAPVIRDDTAATFTTKVSNFTVEPAKGSIVGRRQWNIVTPMIFDCVGPEYTVEAGTGHGFAVFLHDDPNAVCHAELLVEEL